MDKRSLQGICITLSLIILSFSTSIEAVAGGEPADFGEFQHLIQLSFSITGELFCGGSILSYYILHPHFDFHQATNDIALLFLKKPLKFNGTVQQIQLPSNQIFSRENIAGWGRTGSSTKTSDHLKKLNIVFGETGVSWVFGAYGLTDKQICSKFPSGVVVCQSESGSSLVCEEERFLPGNIFSKSSSSFPVICGFLSWIETNGYCVQCKSVAAFFNVSKYLDWTYETTERNGVLSPSSPEQACSSCAARHRGIPNFPWFIYVAIAILLIAIA